MSLMGLLIWAGVYTLAVLTALGASSLWRVIFERLEWTVHLAPDIYHLSLSIAEQNQDGEQGLLRVIPALGPGEKA